MLINYRTLTGSDVFYWNGEIYFWMPTGVYTVLATQIHPHQQYTGKREVTLDMEDSKNGKRRQFTEYYNKDFDDYEIIHRWLWGTAACDCIRGKHFYDNNQPFKCNMGKQNRFILHRMTIKGEHNCVLKYKEFK